MMYDILNEKDNFMRIYIAGKVTGAKEPIKTFNKMRLILQQEYPEAEIIDPVAMTHEINALCPTFQHWEYMQICILALKTCTHICLMPGWEDSEGAREEVRFAIDNRIKLIVHDPAGMRGDPE